MSINWEHLVVEAVFDASKRDWVVQVDSSTQIYGLSKICDYFGQRTWELVSVVSANETITTHPEIFGRHQGAISSRSYVFFFKRPKLQ